MLIVVSPAKKLNMDPINSVDVTEPIFKEDVKSLINIARDLSSNELKDLMGISPKLADLNKERFLNFGNQEKKAAVFAFAGDTYKGLDIEKLNENDLDWAQKHLRILSGLYGLLRPLDLIEPYRLEMGSKLKGDHGNTLYEFWDNKISQNLNKYAREIGTNTLVNCASNEYFSVIKPDTLALKVVTPVFMERKNGKDKIISFYAKNARGAMARFIIQNQITEVENIKNFNLDRYSYNHSISDESKFIFIRES
ncbi:peroxide stress protein YaaA [Alphaproteobacteria bacterium]|nr:peroxide stress protein YaaA [Alphaproteobacteria bacterium]